MSVLIKGMEMPSNCIECWFFDDARCYLYSSGVPNRYHYSGDTKPDWCELVGLPTPHGRLIDADAFEDFIRKYWDKDDHWIAEVVYSRPTIIEAEVGDGT